MSEWLNKNLQVKILLKLAFWQIVFYSVGSLAMSWMSQTNQVDMSQLGWFAWMQTFIGCLGQWCLVMAAFMSKTAGQIASGSLPGVEEPVKEKPTP